MQELYLSPRILHSVENLVSWECIHTPLQIGDAEPPTWAALLCDGRHTASCNDCWRKLVAEYSACQMTMPGDKLVAVAGIVEQLDTLFPNTLSYNYYCGIFNTDIERSILWYSNQAPKPLQKHLYRAPTWSWASVDGSLAFAAFPNGAEVTGCATFRSISPTGYCANTTEAMSWAQFSGSVEAASCSLVIYGLPIEREYAVWQRECSSIALAPENGPRPVGVWADSSDDEITWEIGFRDTYGPGGLKD